MDLATCVGICIVGGTIFIAVAWARDALRDYDKRKAEERQERSARHPILYNILGGIIAWKTMEIWNRSHDASRKDDSPDGRSVYEDLDLD